ncbi:archaemetzincin family Zn-dependent metalloprotease [Thermodesulfobacteriota bacterium]
MIALHKHKIVISPIGDLDRTFIKRVGKGVSQRFGYEIEIISLLNDIDFAFDPSRNQFYSSTILESLATLAPLQAIKVLAICEVDLFIPILTHVYGEAQLGGKACIISTYRLNDGLPPINPQKNYYQRATKEAIHELGHTFNLRHCKDQSCGMHYCRTVKDVDIKSDHFCRYCRVLFEDDIKRLEKSG